MEAVIFIGLQASGKSTFYQRRFFNTHVRINLDMLRTRHRERLLLRACLAAGQPFVVDNTNPTAAQRVPYIQAARQAGFRVVGYYFQSRAADCLRRNESREGPARIPKVGILGTCARLERPAWREGFDQLFYVRIDEQGEFVVAEWEGES